jgi:hypothetical protein
VDLTWKGQTINISIARKTASHPYFEQGNGFSYEINGVHVCISHLHQLHVLVSILLQIRQETLEVYLLVFSLLLLVSPQKHMAHQLISIHSVNS